jgi:hypothetical protein
MTTLAQKVAEPQFAGLPENVVAAMLNTPDPEWGQRRVDVPTSAAKDILLATGEAADVSIAADNPALAIGLRRDCIILRYTVFDTAAIRTGDPAIYDSTEALLAGLVTGGVLTSGTRDALLALADVPQSWAEANDIEVTARTVGLARGAR